MQKKEGKNPVFDPIKVGIKGADFWEKEYKEVEINQPKKQKSIS